MAYDIEIVVTCNSCGGAGSRIIGYEEDETPIYENPCGGCGGDGYITTSRMDSSFFTEKFDALDTKLDAIDAHLDTIESKIDALGE